MRSVACWMGLMVFCAVGIVVSATGTQLLLRASYPSLVQPIGCTGLGLFAVGCCAYFLRRMSWIRRLTERGVVVDGRVLVVDQNSEDVWYLIVGYEWDGVPHRAWQGTGDKSKFQPGDTVRLLVDPARPDKAWPAES